MTDDSLSIGLLLYDGQKYWLRFSEERKTVAKNLIGENAATVDFVVKQLNSYVEITNKEVSKSKNELFELNIQLDILLNSEYLNYLNNYSNGLLRFSKPNLLDDNINEEKFEKLFEILIGKKVEKAIITKKSYKNFNQLIRKNLIERVQDKIYTNIEIDNKISPSMLFEYKMDCIGLNGVFTGAKAIRFNRAANILDNEISHYLNLIMSLSTDYKKIITENNFYLIADEPANITSTEHIMWENAYRSPFFKVINVEEVNIVAEKVEQTNAKMFL